MPTKINFSEKPLGETIADYGSALELGGYGAQFFKNPWALGIGTAAAMAGGLARTWGDRAAGNNTLGGALSETVGDIAFPLVGLFAPQLGQTRAMRALASTKAADNATKTERAINAAKNIGRTGAKYGLAAGTAGAINYGIPGMIDSGTLDPTYGFDYLNEDLSNLNNPAARSRLATTFVLPIGVHYMNKLRGARTIAAGTGATSGAATGAEAATGAATSGTASAATTGVEAAGAASGTAGATSGAATGATSGAAGTAAGAATGASTSGAEAAAPSIIGLAASSIANSANARRQNVAPALQPMYNGAYGPAAKLMYQTDRNAYNNKKDLGTRVSNAMTDYVRNRVQQLRQLRRR